MEEVEGEREARRREGRPNLLICRGDFLDVERELGVEEGEEGVGEEEVGEEEVEAVDVDGDGVVEVEEEAWEVGIEGPMVREAEEVLGVREARRMEGLPALLLWRGAEVKGVVVGEGVVEGR